MSNSKNGLQTRKMAENPPTDIFHHFPEDLGRVSENLSPTYPRMPLSERQHKSSESSGMHTYAHSGYPSGFCSPKALASLNVGQWLEIHRVDMVKASFSQAMADEYGLELVLHLASCHVCSWAGREEKRSARWAVGGIFHGLEWFLGAQAVVESPGGAVAGGAAVLLHSPGSAYTSLKVSSAYTTSRGAT